MASKKEHIEVKVSVESIRDRLRKLLVSENSNLIANVIISSLSTTEIGLDQLFKAMSGIEDKFKFKVGDQVMIEPSSLGTWKFNLDETKIAGLVFQGRIKAQIRSINRHSRYAYTVSFTAIPKVGSEAIRMDTIVSEEQMCLEDEWPLDNTDDNDNLPF